MARASILVVDDDEPLRKSLGRLVESLGHRAIPAGGVDEAKSVLSRDVVDLVITDLRMPGGSGLDLLEEVRRERPDVPVIVLTAYATVETAVRAMHEGAFDYLVKPFDGREMELRIDRALTLRRYRAENSYLREDSSARSGLDDLIGVSAALGRVVDLIKRVAPSDSSVLITGETGTGKELAARAIHRRSSRHEGLFVPVNLAAVPAELMEAELFGHTKGAFTGAVAERAGKFEQADGGTLFLDEIGETPPALQPKLLRVLQDKLVERVGSNAGRTIDVRVISATHRDLPAEIDAGRFRADLYYRLNVIEIAMPPLRERREDIRYLTANFLRRFAGNRPGGSPPITEEALERLEEYPWPGNVRELANVVERAVVLRGEDPIDANLLGLRRRAEAGGASPPASLRLDAALDQLEREMILRALDEARQVKARAARLLGVSERSLWYKLRKHGLS